MNNYDISVFMPSIRTHKQPGWYESISRSCKNHSFQAVIAGPFELHEEIRGLSNVKFIKTYSHPTKSAQLAAIECDGDLIYHTTDDVLFYEDAIDKCIWYFKSVCSNVDIVSMRYIEGANHSNQSTYPPEYWSMQNFLDGNGAPHVRVPDHWRTNAQFLMKKQAFVDLGGFDCALEYLTHAAADLELRSQITGARVYDSPIDVCNADWYEGTTVDHAPIHYAQIEHDAVKFRDIWAAAAQANKREIVALDNYKNYPEHWVRRFGNENPSGYHELKIAK